MPFWTLGFPLILELIDIAVLCNEIVFINAVLELGEIDFGLLLCSDTGTGGLEEEVSFELFCEGVASPPLLICEAIIVTYDFGLGGGGGAAIVDSTGAVIDSDENAFVDGPTL